MVRDKILITEFIKDKNIGAVASASNQVIRKMLKKVDFSKAGVLVEFGPGKGVITKQLLSKMKKDAVLYVFETNEELVNDLYKINDSRLRLFNEDAEKVITVLRQNNYLETADYIISSIPFTFIDRRKRKRIIFNAHALLRENGKFITYQYSWLIYNLLKEQFSKSSLALGLLNIPPTFILEGLK